MTMMTMMTMRQWSWTTHGLFCFQFLLVRWRPTGGKQHSAYLVYRYVCIKWVWVYKLIYKYIYTTYIVHICTYGREIGSIPDNYKMSGETWEKEKERKRLVSLPQVTLLIGAECASKLHQWLVWAQVGAAMPVSRLWFFSFTWWKSRRPFSRKEAICKRHSNTVST